MEEATIMEKEEATIIKEEATILDTEEATIMEKRDGENTNDAMSHWLWQQWLDSKTRRKGRKYNDSYNEKCQAMK